MGLLLEWHSSKNARTWPEGVTRSRAICNVLQYFGTPSCSERSHCWVPIRLRGNLHEQIEGTVILSMLLVAKAAFIPDKDTGNHVRRVNKHWCRSAYRVGLNKAFCNETRFAAELEDINKMSASSEVRV